MHFNRGIFFALTAAFMATSGAFSMDARQVKAKTVTEASDARIVYMGRTLKQGGDVSFDWSGTTCRVRFKGTSIALKCSDTGANYYNVWFDKDSGDMPDLTIRTSGKDTTILLAGKLGKGEHEVTLMKRTEGEQGLTTFHAFETDGGLMQASPAKDRHIEFIGDSYTCGFGTESMSGSDPFTPETENCNLTYAAIVSRYFNADFNLVSHSGRGVIRNYDDFGKGVPGTTVTDKYGRMFDERETPLAGPATVTPDLVVIYLGTNDFSTGMQPHLNAFCDAYLHLIGQIRSRYGAEVPILCMASKFTPGIGDYVKEVCKRSADPRIHSLVLQQDIHNATTDLGACGHPNYKGQKKIASAVIPYVSTITGWEMSGDAIK